MLIQWENKQNSQFILILETFITYYSYYNQQIQINIIKSITKRCIIYTATYFDISMSSSDSITSVTR